MISNVLVAVVEAYLVVMIVYALLSWFPIEPGTTMARVQYELGRFIEPVLRPVRRVIPPVGGLDLSFLVVVLVLQLVIIPLLAR